MNWLTIVIIIVEILAWGGLILLKITDPYGTHGNG